MVVFCIFFTIYLQLVLSQDIVSCKDETDCDDTASMVQVLPATPAPLADMHSAISHRFPWDLAHVGIPVKISPTSASEFDFLIYSAVPVFGEEDSYIALLSDNVDQPISYQGRRLHPSMDNRPWTYMEDHKIFCKGEWSKGEERQEVQIEGRSLLCPWPVKDREKTQLKVFLEDESGKTLGTVWATQAPGMLKKYNTMACVRDVFDQPPDHYWQGAFSGPFKQLVEWVEFHAVYGVDHFIFYTFKGNTDATLEVMRPYLDAGIATRVHFDHYPSESLHRFGFLSNDCLFRAKNHAKWLMPTIDFDEYIHPQAADLTNPKPRTYFSDLWDEVLKRNNKERSQVHQFTMKRLRFARPHPDELEISSIMTEPELQAGNPKYVVNPDVSHQISVHNVEVHDEDTEAVEVPTNVAVVHHYRLPRSVKMEYDGKFKDPDATVKDASFKDSVPILEKALQKRFDLKSKNELKKFLRKMSDTHPTRAGDLSKLDPFGKR